MKKGKKQAHKRNLGTLEKDRDLLIGICPFQKRQIISLELKLDYFCHPKANGADRF